MALLRNTTVTVLTDLEPDDVLAIDALLRNNCVIDQLILGEGNAVEDKAARAYEHWGDRIKAYRCGPPSGKLFPEKKRSVRPPLSQDYDLAGSNLVVLRPPRELVGLPDICKTITCYMYGSFNLRELGMSAADLQRFLHSFRALWVYESYPAIGDANTLNPSCFEISLLPPFVRQCMADWDAFCLQDCRDTLADLPAEGRSPEQQRAYDRNLKCAEQIERYQGKQMVLADIGLALSEPGDYTRGLICVDPDTGYLSCEPDDGSTQHYVHHIGRDALLSRLKFCLM